MAKNALITTAQMFSAAHGGGWVAGYIHWTSLVLWHFWTVAERIE